MSQTTRFTELDKLVCNELNIPLQDTKPMLLAQSNPSPTYIFRILHWLWINLIGLYVISPIIVKSYLIGESFWACATIAPFILTAVNVRGFLKEDESSLIYHDSYTTTINSDGTATTTRDSSLVGDTHILRNIFVYLGFLLGGIVFGGLIFAVLLIRYHRNNDTTFLKVYHKHLKALPSVNEWEEIESNTKRAKDKYKSDLAMLERFKLMPKKAAKYRHPFSFYFADISPLYLGKEISWSDTIHIHVACATDKGYYKVKLLKTPLGNRYTRYADWQNDSARMTQDEVQAIILAEK